MRAIVTVMGFCGCLLAARAEIQVAVEHVSAGNASGAFVFEKIPSPRRGDAAAKGSFRVLSGRPDGNSPGASALNDDRLPADEDAPGASFFFAAGTDGGRLVLDLGKFVAIGQVNSYSWHPADRGPQVYRLFATEGEISSDATATNATGALEAAGWKVLAAVDTRPAQGRPGGQYGVSITGTNGTLGNFRYLLFDISATERNDPFGNTFFQEVDVIEAGAPPPGSNDVIVAGGPLRERITFGDGYEFTLDAGTMPELVAWAHEQLVPMVREWYPQIVQRLPSEGYAAPRRFSIVMDPNMRGVAETGGTRVRCSGPWLRDNLKGEAMGAVFHELVHVVQQYGSARRPGSGAERPPGWLVEGIADYVRWYVFEPQSGGAAISPARAARARYDGGYRPTANFLNWVATHHDVNLVRELNAAIREGRYSQALWKERTGETLPELGEHWRASLAAAQPPK